MIAQMHRILPALVVRMARSLAVLCLPILVAACGGGGLDSPEAVFHRVQELNESGEVRKIWDLYTAQEKERQGRAYDEYVKFLVANPVPINRQKCLDNFRVEPEQLATMTHIEIFEQQVSEPSRRAWLIGATIIDVEPAPDIEDGMRVRWETAQGMPNTMLTQYVDGRYYLITLRE
jgi:hypothetical protein